MRWDIARELARWTKMPDHIAEDEEAGEEEEAEQDPPLDARLGLIFGLGSLA